MLSPHAYTIRPAEASDEPTLAFLAVLAGEAPLTRPALIGDVDGVPAAALSLVDGRAVADPYRPSSGLVRHLRLHRSGWRPRQQRHAVRDRVRAVLPFMA
jgi:hypothetical protein